MALSILAFLLLAGGAVAATAHWLERPRPDLLEAENLPRRRLLEDVIRLAPRDMSFSHLPSKDLRRAARRGAMQFERKLRRRGRRLNSNVPLYLGWAAGGPEAVFLRRPVESSGAYRLTAKVSGGSPGGQASLIARWLDAEGRPSGELALAVRPSEGWREISEVGAAPEGTTAVELVAIAWESDRPWRLDSPRLERLAGVSAAPTLARLDYFNRRLGSLASLWSAEGISRERSLAVRLAESRALLELFVAAPPFKKLLGHGLGATFRIPDHGPVIPAVAGELGVEGEGEEQNYIHNFYAFLFYKLGIVGALLVLAALAAWLVTTFRWARAWGPGPERRFLAAAGAAWVAYLILSLSSPEILDFRIAPLWGFLLAATLACRPEGREKASEPD